MKKEEPEDQYAKLLELFRKPMNAEGISTTDLAKHLGVSMVTAGEKIRQQIAAGKLEYCGKRKTVNMANGTSLVPVYRLKKTGG